MPKAQQGFFLDLRKKIDEYAGQNPSCDFVELCEAYGEPGEVAQYYLNGLDPELFLQAKKRRNRLLSVILALVIVLALAVAGVLHGQGQSKDVYPIRNVDYKGASSYQKTWNADAKDGNHLNVSVENVSDSNTPVSVELHSPGSANYLVAFLQPGKNQIWNLGNAKGFTGKYELVISESDGSQMHVHVNARQYGRGQQSLK